MIASRCRSIAPSPTGIDDNQGLSPTEKTATIRNLISARSCIYHQAAYETKEQIGRRPERHSCRPGERWFYNNWDFNALGTIYQTVAGVTLFLASDAASEMTGQGINVTGGMVMD